MRPLSSPLKPRSSIDETTFIAAAGRFTDVSAADVCAGQPGAAGFGHRAMRPLAFAALAVALLGPFAGCELCNVAEQISAPAITCSAIP